MKVKKTYCFVLILLVWGLGCGGYAQNKKKIKPTKELTPAALKRQGYQRKEQDTFMVKDGKLDIKLLEEIGRSVDAAVPTEDGGKITRSYGYETTLEDGTYIHIYGDELSGYTKSIIKKDSYLETYYVYYPSGKLERVGMLYDRGFRKGTWYWYNERGQINRLEEYDKPYAFTWEKVLVFMQQKEIKKQDIFRISRWVDKKTKKPFWSIEFTLKRDYNNNTVLSRYYKLDGTTGAIIEEREKTYVYEES